MTFNTRIISSLKKYVFALVVSAYVLSVVGVPVYLHYCGGELETVTYVIKSNSCCGSDDDEAMKSDCCKDENMVLKNSTDFTWKQSGHHNFVKRFCQLFYLQRPFSTTAFQIPGTTPTAFAELIPPKLRQSLIISTSVLRI